MHSGRLRAAPIVVPPIISYCFNNTITVSFLLELIYLKKYRGIFSCPLVELGKRRVFNEDRSSIPLTYDLFHRSSSIFTGKALE